MDPFIEAHGLWEDFHSKLIGEIERALAPRLPEGYVVRTLERAYLEAIDPADGTRRRHSLIPDLKVEEQARGRGLAGAAAAF
jgi:hypothetical protein